MANVNNNLTNKLIQLIQNVSRKVVDNKTKNMPKEWVAVVATGASPNGIATVYLNGDLTSTPISMKNKSWETLASSDEIYIHSPSGKLSNAIILYKK